jgi:hypothetical protein
MVSITPFPLAQRIKKFRIIFFCITELRLKYSGLHCVQMCTTISHLHQPTLAWGTATISRQHIKIHPYKSTVNLLFNINVRSWRVFKCIMMHNTVVEKIVDSARMSTHFDFRTQQQSFWWFCWDRSTFEVLYCRQNTVYI